MTVVITNTQSYSTGVFMCMNYISPWSFIATAGTSIAVLHAAHIKFGTLPLY